MNQKVKKAEAKLFPSRKIGEPLTDREENEVEKLIAENEKGTFASWCFTLYFYFNLPGALLLVTITQGNVEEFKQWQNLLATSVVYWVLFLVII